ncbi:hypothetical protein HCR_21520 [Hydrogenimonas cancrithermarum]|uniref:Uncharacterized protein n=1 Tax=Hydrogenimonas cancrithermarum TaxID=2993563 RepID=A0ABN6WX43_9BACT|nr:hypothetical protein HCR_21520 [Hydrogenimonas cancrithermarum]
MKKETSSPAPTYLPTPEGCSIISAEGLDFQVRDGAGYNPLAIGTGTKRGKTTLIGLALFARSNEG